MNTKERIAVSAKSGVSLATIVKFDKGGSVHSAIAKAIEQAMKELRINAKELPDSGKAAIT